MLHLVSAVALLIVGGKFDVDATVVAEGRAGLTPVIGVGGPSTSFVRSSEPSIAGVVTPAAEVRFQGHELLAQLAYGVRIYDGITRTLPTAGPLFLQTATLSLRAVEGPRFTGTATATAAYGSADYAYLPQVLGAGQATLPQPVKFFSIAGSALTVLRLTHLWSWETTAEAVDRRPLDDGPPKESAPNTVFFAFPRQTSFYLTPAAVGRVTRVDDLILAVGGIYQSTAGQSTMTANSGLGPVGPVKIATLAPTVGWRTRLSKRYDFHLAGGLAFNHVVEYPEMLPRPAPVAPTGAVDLGVHFVTRREVTVRGTFGAVVDYFVDPILGTSAPRGASFARLLLFFPLDWTLGLEATFSTLLTTNPHAAGIASGAMFRDPDETAVALAIPARHRITRNYALEFGLRLSDRAPNFWSSDFSFDAHEAWLYFQLTATTRPIPDYRPAPDYRPL